MVSFPKARIRDKRAKSGRSRRRLPIAASVSLRHVGIALALLLALGGGAAGWIVGGQEARVAALTATRLAERGEIGPAARSAKGTRDSKGTSTGKPSNNEASARTARDAAFAPMRWRLSLALLLASLGAVSMCLFLFRRLVIARIEHVVAHIRRAARTPDSIGRLGRLVPGPFDTREMVALLTSINDGLAELELRNRARALVKDTAERLRAVDEDAFLARACDGIALFGEASQARAWIVRAKEGESGYLIERRSESRLGSEDRGAGTVGAGGTVGSGGASGTRGRGRGRGERPPPSRNDSDIDDLLSRGNMAEYQGEAALQFLRGGHALDWVSSILYLRTDLTPGGEMVLVTAVTSADQAEGRAALTPVQFEHLCSLWASEVARAWHQSRFQDLASNLEFSRQLRRTWVQSSGPGRQGPDPLAHANVPSRFINGDFQCVFRLGARDASIVVLGDVTGHELVAGLAATGCVAAASDRFHSLKDAPSHRLLEGLVESLNRYVWNSHAGALGLRALLLHVEHGSGQGSVCCFGSPFPYVVSAQERKPMVVVPQVNPGMMGLAATIDATPTAFTLLPGQALFASTEGLLALPDAQGKRFDKLLQRGFLSEIMGNDTDATAATLLGRLLDEAHAHAGNASVREDLTAVVAKGPARR